MAFEPRWVYYPDGTALLVVTEADFQALPPGWKDNPGKFLSPEDPRHVPEDQEPAGTDVEILTVDESPAPPAEPVGRRGRRVH